MVITYKVVARYITVPHTVPCPQMNGQ